MKSYKIKSQIWNHVICGIIFQLVDVPSRPVLTVVLWGGHGARGKDAGVLEGARERAARGRTLAVYINIAPRSKHYVNIIVAWWHSAKCSVFSLSPPPPIFPKNGITRAHCLCKYRTSVNGLHDTCNDVPYFSPPPPAVLPKMHRFKGLHTLTAYIYYLSSPYMS